MKFNSNPSVGSSGDFLKLKDGESVVGVFRGDILEYHCKWNGSKSVKCDAEEKGAKFRFRINFVTKQGDALKSVLWEQGAQVYNDLKALNGDYPLEQFFMKITRKGAGMNDTEYHILPVPNGQLDATKEAMVAAVPLQDLNSGLDNTQAAQPPMPTQADELPF